MANKERNEKELSKEKSLNNSFSENPNIIEKNFDASIVEDHFYSQLNSGAKEIPPDEMVTKNETLEDNGPPGTIDAKNKEAKICKDDLNIRLESSTDYSSLESDNVKDQEKKDHEKGSILFRLLRFLICTLKKEMANQNILKWTDSETLQDITKSTLVSKIIIFIITLCLCLLTMAPELILIDHYVYMENFKWFGDRQFLEVRKLIWLASGSVLLLSSFLLQGLLSKSRIVMIVTSMVGFVAGCSFAVLSTLAVKFLVILDGPDQDEVMYKFALLIPLPYIALGLFYMSGTLIMGLFNQKKAESKSTPTFKVMLNTFNFVCFNIIILHDLTFLGLLAEWKTMDNSFIRSITFPFNFKSVAGELVHVDDYLLFLQSQTCINAGMLLLLGFHCLHEEIKVPKLFSWLGSVFQFSVAPVTVYLSARVQSLFTDVAHILYLKYFACGVVGLAGLCGTVANFTVALKAAYIVVLVAAVFVVFVVSLFKALLTGLFLVCLKQGNWERNSV